MTLVSIAHIANKVTQVIKFTCQQQCDSQAVPLHLILRRLQCSVPPFCSALFTIKIVSCCGAPLAAWALHDAVVVEKISADRCCTVVVGQVEDDGWRVNVKLEISPLWVSKLRFSAKIIKCCAPARRPSIQLGKEGFSKDVLIPRLFKFFQSITFDVWVVN